MKAKPLMASASSCPTRSSTASSIQALDQPTYQKGFLLDGFRARPAGAGARRSVAEARAQDHHVLLLECRSSCWSNGSRAVRPARSGQTSYGKDSPLKSRICDNDGEKLIVRPDDQPESVRRRMVEYETKTALLTGYYKTRGVVRPWTEWVAWTTWKSASSGRWLTACLAASNQDTTKSPSCARRSLIVYEVLERWRKAPAGRHARRARRHRRGETLKRGGIARSRAVRLFQAVCISVNETGSPRHPTRRSWSRAICSSSTMA